MNSTDRFVITSSARIVRNIRWWMAEGKTYAEAREFVAEQNRCAGPKVWARVDAEMREVQA